MNIDELPHLSWIYCVENGAQFDFSIKSQRQEDEFIAFKMKKEGLTRQQIDEIDVRDRRFICLDTMDEVEELDKKLSATI